MACRTNFNILHWNTNGIQHKTFELTQVLNKLNIDICLINETKLIKKDKIYFANYKMLRKDREGENRGGGLIILIKHDIKFSQIQSKTTICESLGIKIDNTALFSIYQRPQSKINRDEINSLLNSCNSCIILGDFNARHRNWGCITNNSNGVQLNNFISSSSANLIFPTNYTYIPSQQNMNPSTIDLGIVCNINKGIKIETLNELNSDHLPIQITINDSNIPLIQLTPTRNTKKTNWNKFQNNLNEFINKVSGDALNLENVDEKIETFSEAITESLNESTPIIINKKATDLPENIKKIINQRNYFRRKYQKKQIYEYKHLYNQLNNIIKKEIHEWRNDT